jgi:hypothetical protein
MTDDTVKILYTLCLALHRPPTGEEARKALDISGAAFRKRIQYLRAERLIMSWCYAPTHHPDTGDPLEWRLLPSQT